MKTVASSGIRHYMPILGPTTPPFSRWSWYPQLVGQSKLNNFFTYLSSRGVGSTRRLVSMCKVVAWGITACAVHRFLGSCFSSCMTMTICSGQVMGQAWHVVKIYGRTWSDRQWGEYKCTTLAITYVFTQIISENTCHRHTIDFHHGYRGIGSYFRQAEDRGRCLPANHVIQRMHTQFSSA